MKDLLIQTSVDSLMQIGLTADQVRMFHERKKSHYWNGMSWKKQREKKALRFPEIFIRTDGSNLEGF